MQASENGFNHLKFHQDPNTKEQLRVIILTHGGAQQVVNRILALNHVSIVGIFVETNNVRRYNPRQLIKRSIRYDGYWATGLKLGRRILRLGHAGGEDLQESRDRLRQIAEDRQIPFHLVSDYHSAETQQLMISARPDLGVVYGTNIIKESVFTIPRLGSINLHQGLAPYYRGGPPIFWELFNGESEVGVTVHFVEAKVDSGPIVLQETVPLSYDYKYGLDYESFIADFQSELHERSARLVAEAVRLIAIGGPVTKVQDCSIGKRYRLPLKAEKDELRRRLRARWLAARNQGSPTEANI